MPKKAEIIPSQTELHALQQLAHNPLEDHRVVERAQIVMACLNRQSLDEISAQFQVSRSMIFRWRARFLQDGVAGLWDKPRTGKPARYDDAFEKQVLDTLATPPPPGQLRWDGQSLAAHLNASDDAVWRVLRRHGLSLVRQRVWTVKTRLNLAGKALHLAGLYIAPPIWIMALRYPQAAPDEAQVYTRNRTAGNALLQAAGQDRELDLKQALSIMSTFPQQIAPNKRREEMLNFINDALECTQPHQKLVILVLGDAASLELSSWVAAHQQVKFFFYENMDAAHARLEFHMPDLGEDYGAFVRQVMAYPHSASPFIWKTIHRDWMDEEEAE